MRTAEERQKQAETKLSDVEVPDCAWITYAVCAGGKESCGWGGWVIEVLVSDEAGKDLSIHDRHLCPGCGTELVLTEASVKLVPAADQSGKVAAGVGYETVPMEIHHQSEL